MTPNQRGPASKEGCANAPRKRAHPCSSQKHTEAGLKYINCRCPAGGRPRPRAIVQGVTWCSCGTRGQLDERTNTRDLPKTPETNTKDPKITTELGEEKNINKNTREETSDSPKKPREEETRNQDIDFKERTTKQDRIQKPESKTITNPTTLRDTRSRKIPAAGKHVAHAYAPAPANPGRPGK